MIDCEYSLLTLLYLDTGIHSVALTNAPVVVHEVIGFCMREDNAISVDLWLSTKRLRWLILVQNQLPFFSALFKLDLEFALQYCILKRFQCPVC
jgi:hypothetical protein